MALFAADHRCVADEPQQQLLAHYMPWFSADVENGKFGYHWTMNHCDPNRIDESGRREIASHHYPLIGTYDSEDPHVLEYHVLLMKFSDIDGVVFDWYGTRDFWDYQKIDRSTQAMTPWLKKAKLDFTFCYEDQTVKHMINNGKIKASEGIAETVSEFDKLAKEYFEDPSWIRSDGKPILLMFGPQHFTPDSWSKVIAKAKSPPEVYGLSHADPAFKLPGSFAWPPVEGLGKIVPVEKWQGHLRYVYNKEKSRKMIPVVFPEFHDYYAQAKVKDNYGHIDDREGATFRKSLQLARETKAEFVQLVTWNDVGEGTTIEPTREFGYRYLEILIEEHANPKFTKEDLKLPLELYKLRKAGDDRADAVSEALFSGRTRRARKLLSLQK
jgi:hypothetical protein